MIFDNLKRELEEVERKNSNINSWKKVHSRMGTTAIIVCQTANVPIIAADCRVILQRPQIKSSVVEAIGTRDAVNVTVCVETLCELNSN